MITRSPLIILEDVAPLLKKQIEKAVRRITGAAERGLTSSEYFRALGLVNLWIAKRPLPPGLLNRWQRLVKRELLRYVTREQGHRDKATTAARVLARDQSTSSAQRR